MTKSRSNPLLSTSSVRASLRSDGDCLSASLPISRTNSARARLGLAGRRIPPCFGIGILAAMAWAGTLPAGEIAVPNGSFEAPPTDFADPRIDSWQKTPKPDWYDESLGAWDQLTGVFRNTPAGSPNHIDNADGDQAIFLFVVPEVGLFQDDNSIDWMGGAPTHAFDARFEVGHSYRLTVGMIGGGGGMLEGASLSIELYYRDGASNKVTVATTNIIHTLETFPTTTRLVDGDVFVPAVQAGDPWAGQNIGIQFISNVSPALAGGYWDLDHVRLMESSGFALSGVHSVDGQFRFRIESAPGLSFEILAATNAVLPISNWTSLGTVTNVTGSVLFADPNPDQRQRFYQARRLP